MGGDEAFTKRFSDSRHEEIVELHNGVAAPQPGYQLGVDQLPLAAFDVAQDQCVEARVERGLQARSVAMPASVTFV